MIEFDTFCYLQNQKTGCTYVETLIRQCTTDDIVRYEKHAPIKRYQADKFYFINVRDPLDTYFSLFNYGLDGKGEIYFKLKYAGFGHFYSKGIEGFEEWLDFILTPEKSSKIEVSLSQKDPALTHSMFGLLSYRFMRLACLDFDQMAPSLVNKDRVEAYFSNHFVMNEVVKNEDMNAALTEIVTGPLKHAFRNQKKTLAWLNKPRRINASVRRDKAEKIANQDVPSEIPSTTSKQGISQALQSKLEAREWLLYQKYYPATT